jgi:hypothetical protein
MSSLERRLESKSQVLPAADSLKIFSSSTNNVNIVTEVNQTFVFPGGSVKPGQNVITVVQVRMVFPVLLIPVNSSSGQYGSERGRRL